MPLLKTSERKEREKIERWPNIDQQESKSLNEQERGGG